MLVKSARNERGCPKGCPFCIPQGDDVLVPEEAIKEIPSYSSRPVCGRVELRVCSFTQHLTRYRVEHPST